MKPIYVTNQSTLVDEHQVRAMTRAVAYQLQHHVAPAWGMTSPLMFYVNDGTKAPAGSILITVLDNSDQANALGYHSENQGELIYGRVFAKPVFDNGGDALSQTLSVSSVLSHEAVEAAIDPSCNRWAQDAVGSLWCLEAGDPVEAQSYVITTQGISATVSNFIYPSWADPDAKLTDKFDYLGELKGPFTIAKDGYALQMQGGKVRQVFGKSYPKWKQDTKKTDLSRTYKRIEMNI